MAELWQGVGTRPILEELDEEAAAEVLLRVGALTGWIGSARQIEGSQEVAKDLISESARFFENLGKRNKVGEAQSDLALCYWRAGAYDEARVILEEALTKFDESSRENRAIALIRKALVERASTRLSDALSIYNQALPLFSEIDDHLLSAHFHHGFANVLNQISSAEHRQDYADQALIEYSAAAFHFEEAGHAGYQACVDINIAFLFFTLNRFSEAHEHLDRAQLLFTKLADNLHLAQVDETRARVLLAEGRIVEAEKTVRLTVNTLEKGHEASWLAEALITHGIALARLKHPERARAALQDAVNLSEQAGDFENAGIAALTIVEQLGRNLTTTELCEIIDHAGTLLEKTQDISTLRRLSKAAFEALFLIQAIPAPPDWNDFSLLKAVRRYEEHSIKLVLKETGGKVTKAAPLLGFKHHQSLISLINHRHKDLLAARSEIRKRKKHIITHPKRAKRKKVRVIQPQATSRVSILHVEKDEQLAKLVSDMVASEEWRVELCIDGYSALDKLTGNNHYDLILVANDIAGLSGLELMQRARTISHRRRTPIIMLSGDDVEREAWQAGVDEFLRKPEAIKKVPSTIARLLGGREEQD